MMQVARRRGWLAGVVITGGMACGMGLLALFADPYLLSVSSEAMRLGVGVALALAAVAMLQVQPAFALVLAPVAIIIPGLHGIFPIEGVALVLATYLAMDALWRGDSTLPGPRWLHLPFIAYLVTGLLPVLVVDNPLMHLGMLAPRVAAYLGFTFVLRYAAGDRWKWFALSIPVTGAAVGLQLLHAYMSRGFHVRNIGILRSFLSNLGWGTSNYVGAVISVAFLGAFILLVNSREWWLRLASAASLAIMGLGSVLLLSRGTIVAILAGLVALLISTRGRRRWWILGMGAAGVALLSRVAAFKLLVARFSSGSQMVSYVDRVRIWEAAVDRFRAHPWLGIGLGQGRTQLDWLQTTDPHNYFLSCASETGIFGLLAWIFLLLAFAAHAVTLPGAARGGRSAWALPATVVLGVAVLNSCYEPTFTGPQYNFLFFWVFAVLVTGPLQEERVPNPRPEAPAGFGAPEIRANP